MLHRKLLITNLYAVIVVLMLVGDAWSMPVFARKYRTSCMTCHEAFPRRNGVGQAFRMNGFRFEDDEIYRKEAPIEMGDEAYERLWPKAIWPDDIPQTVPLSIATRFLMEIDTDGTRKDPVTFLLPEEIELVWAGTLGDNITFYGDIIHLQKDFGGKETQGWTTLKAWFEFQNLLGDDNHLNLRMGTVGTHSLGLYTARDSNNCTTHFYQYTTWIMPTVDLEAADLAGFEGNNFSIQPQMGFELNGRFRRWAYATGVVAGNVAAPPNEAPEAPIAFAGTSKTVDNKDVYGQLAFKIGGIPFDGRTSDQDGKPVDPTAGSADYWRDDSLLLSVFGYYGRAQIITVDTSDAKMDAMSPFWRAGVGFLQKYKDFNLGAGYVVGWDEKPYTGVTEEAVDSQTWLVETMWFAYPWLIPYVRYEGMNLDLPQDVPGVRDGWKIQRLLPGVKALIRPNVAVTVEFPVYFEGAHLEEGFDRSVFMLLNVAF